MATEGAALSHLRDAYYILTHDLASADLAGLQDLIQQNPASLVAANKIAPVVSKLALVMMKFGTAVDDADELVKSSQTSTRLMITIVALIMATITGVGVYMLYLVVSKTVKGLSLGSGPLFELSNLGPIGVGLSALVSPIGGIIIGLTVFLVFMMGWIYLLKDKLSQLEGPEAVLRAGFWKIRNQVCGAYAIRFEAASQQGTLNDLKNGTGQWHVRGSDLIAAPQCGDEGIQDETAPTCGAQIDVCGTTVPTLAAVIVASCKDEISTMLSAFQDLQALGVDNLDRIALWKSISIGIDALRKTIAVSADADATSPPVEPVTASNVLQIITTDVVSKMENMTLKTPLVSPPTADDLKEQSRIFSKMTSDVIAVVQARQYAFDVSDYRAQILTQLTTYYGDAFDAIRMQLNTVITHVQNAADTRPPALASMYVDSAAMMARIINMGPTAWEDVVTAAHATNDSVHTFLANFKPAGVSSLAGNVTHGISVGLTVVGIIGLLIYTNSIWQRVSAGTMTLELAARTMIITASMFALLVLAVHGAIGRMISRQSHNSQAIVRNGQKFSSSLEATLELATRIAKDPVSDTSSTGTSTTPLTPTAADVQRYIDSAIDTIHAYDSCNSITNGARLMPFPTMDLIIYAFVVATILASAMYGLEQLRLREKISNIKTLTLLTERVRDGLSPPGMLKQIECCTPDESHRMIFIWMALLILFAFNIYAMSNINASQRDYDRSLELVDDCV